MLLWRICSQRHAATALSGQGGLHASGRLITIDVPGDLQQARISEGQLPPGWRTLPAPPELQRIGTDWLAGGATPLLVVPSAIVPDSENVLVNPQHPDAGRCRVVEDRPFTFDARLLPR